MVLFFFDFVRQLNLQVMSYLQINLYALYNFELNTSIDNTSKYLVLIKV